MCLFVEAMQPWSTLALFLGATLKVNVSVAVHHHRPRTLSVSISLNTTDIILASCLTTSSHFENCLLMDTHQFQFDFSLRAGERIIHIAFLHYRFNCFRKRFWNRCVLRTLRTVRSLMNTWLRKSSPSLRKCNCHRTTLTLLVILVYHHLLKKLSEFRPL